jgi:PadR family transcriptional regulator, regulatory protein PadR
MRVESELMRGAGVVALLQILARGEMYGYEIVQALGEVASGALAMGQSTVYPMLYNLEAKGLVTSRWEDTEGGRRRKYYSLTDAGRKHLAAQRRQWQALVDALGELRVVGPPARAVVG